MKYYKSSKYNVEVEMREHGDWKLVDFWLRIFVWIKSFFNPSWGDIYRSSWSTVSVFSKTIYTYDINRISLEAKEHECNHVRQFLNDILMPVKYIFWTPSRIKYETEAYINNNYIPESIALKLINFYMMPPWWSFEEVLSEVQKNYTK